MLTWAPHRQPSSRSTRRAWPALGPAGRKPRRRGTRFRSLLGIGITVAAVGVGLFGPHLGPAGPFADLLDGSQSSPGTRAAKAPSINSGRLALPNGQPQASESGDTASDYGAAGVSDARAASGASGASAIETRTIGSLPASAGSGAGATTDATARELPSSDTAALPAWRLSAPVSYASGAIKARPLPRSVSPIRRRGAVTAIATKLASQQFGGSLRPADVDTFFAEFDAPVGEWLGKVESVETEPRSVWFVVFTGMESSRSTGVVIRRRDAASAPTTASLRVISDVVVVIDDDTGEVLVASEYLSETSPTR